MPKKPSDAREKTRSETRGSFDRRAGRLLAGNIIAFAAAIMLFDDDDTDGTEPSQETADPTE